MQTPDEEARALIDAEKRSVVHKLVRDDDEFNEMMNDMLHLQEKYGTRRLKCAIMDDYRNINWIHLFSTN